MLARDIDAESTGRLRQIAETLDESPVLAAVIRELARRRDRTKSYDSL